jgi:DNA-binding SARP family transcriptional activator
MRCALLGPLRILDDEGGSVALTGAHQRSLLACLLIRANTPVSHDALIDMVWDGRRSAGPPTMVRSVVMRLRQSLGPGPAARIVARPPGYLIRVDESELDTLRFEALCHDAGRAVQDGAWAAAARASAQALALWRGMPLLDVPTTMLRDQVTPRLEQLRLQVLEDGARAELHLGHHEQLIPRLRDLTAGHPLRERFHAQLVLALARTGRQAEALAAYQQARQALVAELGVEPRPELCRLHERILVGDTELLPPPVRTRSAAPQARAPRQLPAGISHFVGRAAELKALSDLLSQQDPVCGAVGIATIGGPPGIGKTALAVHWAHQHADRFPDGQLYLDLGGVGPAPLAPADAVRRLLGALGVPAHRIPADLDEQAALYRTLVADRRVLVVLDHARDVQQVRPLLPGAPGCLVLVTSRRQLTDLVALHGAVPVTLDPLAETEARDLLVSRLGGERLAWQESAVAELIAACARQPLALNVAAAHAALHPTRPLRR